MIVLVVLVVVVLPGDSSGVVITSDSDVGSDG